MKSVKNRFKKTKIKNLFFIVGFFVLVFIASSYVFFKSYKDNLISLYKKDYSLNINYLNSKFDAALFLNKHKEIESTISHVLETGNFSKIALKYQKFLFDKNTLIDNTLGITDKSWKIADVVVDARSGYIRKIKGTSLYEYVPNSGVEVNKDITIRYQLYKKNEIRNFFVKLSFDNLEQSRASKDVYIFPFISSLVDIPTLDFSYDIIVENQVLAKANYTLNDKNILITLQNYAINLFIFTLIMFSPIVFLIVFYHKYIFNKYVTKPIDYLNKYLDDIDSNKFQVIQKKNFEGTDEINELTSKISKISSKIATLTNELNLSKDSLQKKNTTDALTGLPNKTVFDFDIKGMFVSSTKAYIYLIKIDELGKLSAKYDNGYINSFIESYVNIIKNIIYKYSKTSIKIYRFYGSEFAIVSKGDDLEKTKEICEEIIEALLDNLPDLFDAPENLIQIGVTSFDLYGSVESVVKSAQDAYSISKDKGINSYHIISEEEVQKNYSLLDNSVLKVIKTDGFDIDFVLDTYTFDEPDTIFMKEVAPLLFDHENKKISIGSFVSVAQKLNIVDMFDKLVIQKSINYLKANNLNYKLAVNITIESIKNASFMTWLENYLDDNKEYKEQIVFSITSYTAYSHKADFVTFVRDIKKIGSKVILKRYKTEDYPLEELENLGIDYLRMNKDYTVNFTNDAVKRHKVKNILIFGDLNSIEIISDSVTVENDYNMLERLGAYATTK